MKRYKDDKGVELDFSGMLPITLRVPDACRLTGIGRSKLYELIKAGDIEIIKVGSMTLIPMASLAMFLDARRRMTVP